MCSSIISNASVTSIRLRGRGGGRCGPDRMANADAIGEVRSVQSTP